MVWGGVKGHGGVGGGVGWGEGTWGCRGWCGVG